MRLFLIGGQLNHGVVRVRCLRALISLARNRDEEIRLRTLAYLQEPSLDESILQPRATQADVPTSNALHELVELVGQIRQSRDGDEVNRKLAEPNIQSALREFQSICTPEQLRRLASARQHTSEELLQLLKLEYAIHERVESWPALKSETSWFQQLDSSSLVEPTWDNVIEFRASDCVYRDGRWTTPRMIH